MRQSSCGLTGQTRRRRGGSGKERPCGARPRAGVSVSPLARGVSPRVGRQAVVAAGMDGSECDPGGHTGEVGQKCAFLFFYEVFMSVLGSLLHIAWPAKVNQANPSLAPLIHGGCVWFACTIGVWLV